LIHDAFARIVDIIVETEVLPTVNDEVALYLLKGAYVLILTPASRKSFSKFSADFAEIWQKLVLDGK